MTRLLFATRSIINNQYPTIKLKEEDASYLLSVLYVGCVVILLVVVGGESLINFLKKRRKKCRSRRGIRKNETDCRANISRPSSDRFEEFGRKPIQYVPALVFSKFNPNRYKIKILEKNFI